jgi:hypothetical protein
MVIFTFLSYTSKKSGKDHSIKKNRRENIRRLLIIISAYGESVLFWQGAGEGDRPPSLEKWPVVSPDF